MQLAGTSCYFTARDHSNDFKTGSNISIIHAYIRNVWFLLSTAIYKPVWRLTMPNLQGFVSVALYFLKKKVIHCSKMKEIHLLPCIICYV